MKITILGAASVRTPLLLQALTRWQARIGVDELALMDIDGERLGLIGALTARLEATAGFRVVRTLDARAALTGADFVLTTFRVGGMEARVVDERAPLRYGVLGQETTGPGGFAMGLRSIPVLLDYVRLMGEVCPRAWLVNFANPSGLLTEAATRLAGWSRTVGICDAPSTMGRVAAAVLGAPIDDVYLDYFGLNHLGWLRAVVYDGRDYLPQLLEMLRGAGGLPGLPFDPEFMAGLGLIPNEYLFYYYATAKAVQNIVQAGQTRGEQLVAANARLFADLRRLTPSAEAEELSAVYAAYLGQREQTYMVRETGAMLHGADGALAAPLAQTLAGGEGYAGVALSVIEALQGGRPKVMILNVPNQGCLLGLPADVVVEIPAWVSRGAVRPLAVPSVPLHCLGLMQQVKAYEQLTLAAAVEGSSTKAVMALALHPLVPDYATAKAILDEYRALQGALFPALR